MDIQILKPKKEHAEDIARLYINEYGGKYPLLEYTKPDAIEKNIENKSLIWYIGIAENKIIASMVGTVEEWNKSYEIGKTVVDKDYSSRGITQKLVKTIRKKAFKICDIELAGMRNNATLHIAKKAGMQVVGIFPGQHYVAWREIHIPHITLNQCAKEKRIAPIENKISASLYVKDIIKKMGLSSAIETYPPDIVVGPRKGAEINGVNYGFFKTDNRVTIYRADKKPIKQIKQVLKLEPFKSAEYIELKLLADKINELYGFMKLDFYPCAYFPAWYLNKGKRYDCVITARSKELTKLAKQEKLETIMDKDVSHEVMRFQEDFLKNYMGEK